VPDKHHRKTVRVTKERITNEMEANKPLSSMQFGFRKGKSTVHAMLEITNHIKELTNKKSRTGTWCVLITLDVRNSQHSFMAYNSRIITETKYIGISNNYGT